MELDQGVRGDVGERHHAPHCPDGQRGEEEAG